MSVVSEGISRVNFSLIFKAQLMPGQYRLFLSSLLYQEQLVVLNIDGKACKCAETRLLHTLGLRILIPDNATTSFIRRQPSQARCERLLALSVTKKWYEYE